MMDINFMIESSVSKKLKKGRKLKKLKKGWKNRGQGQEIGKQKRLKANRGDKEVLVMNQRVEEKGVEGWRKGGGGHILRQKRREEDTKKEGLHHLHLHPLLHHSSQRNHQTQSEDN